MCEKMYAPIKMAESMPANSILQKFQMIEHNFNKNYLTLLFQVREIPNNEGEQDIDPRDAKQFELLNDSYTHWYHKLQENPKDMDACTHFYNAVKDYHEILMKRDTQIFTINGDFFANVFNKPGVDTPYLYDSLADALDEVDEKQDPNEPDAKENLWSSIIGLYRLCVLIMIYLKLPIVKELIDLILMSNPDLNQTNIFEKIFSEFKGTPRIRKLIMKLLKSKEDAFSDIFTSLGKVVAAFSSEVPNVDMNMQANLNKAKMGARGVFVDILKQSGVRPKEDVIVDQFMEAMEEKKEDVLQDFVEEKRLSADQLKAVKDLYHAKGLDRININKTVKDLGVTMENMMKAISSGDEDAVKKVLASAGPSFNMDSTELESMQAEMESFEKELEDETDE